MRIIMIILCIALAAAFIYEEKQGKYTAAVILKGLASACFVTLGFMNSNGSAAAKTICTGLVLGCIADILLNLRFVFKEQGQKIFLVGILVFLSGHIAYLIAVMPFNPNPLVSVLAAIVLTALLMVWIFKKIEAEKAFKIFGVVYLGAIVFLNVAAFGNLFANSGSFFKVFAAGTVLFLISDIVLILNTFGPETKFSLRVTNLSLYYLGQILIAMSLTLL